MTRIVYSDLDGTMVGPGGTFFRAADHTLTLEPARALLELHAAGVTLVLVSGRTRAQLVEACRVFGAEGFVAELGSVIGWEQGRRHEVLRGVMPASYAGAPADAVEAAGVPARLFEHWPGMIEYHSPWHVGHEGDVMLRGCVEVAEVESWLAGEGFGWLRLHDNGVLPARRPTSLRPEAIPAHVYHLMPGGLSKGSAVARDLDRRGLTPADAAAIGDSLSDLDMAAHVERVFVTANGARNPAVVSAVGALRNAELLGDEVGLGWADAVRRILDGS
jgi:hydroxymethylpyrimidine pyrophosphatase-like HAD family hydrolase